MKHPTIAVLGTGTMGQAIIDGLLAAGHPRPSIRSTTRTAASAKGLSARIGIVVTTDNPTTARDADVIVLALKPMNIEPICRLLKGLGSVKKDAVVVSIAAGVTLPALTKIFGPDVAIIRAMPNTPCAIGKGMTVLARGGAANDADIALAQKIFSPLGRVVELEEKHMDTVTGLSASGPAFVFVMIEALADGGVARGLPRQVALEMASQMVYGAAAMVLESGRHPAALKDEVTTPAGCTIAGILILEDGRIRSVLARAVEVASVRASELGGPNE
jgi:pyrroline-5-carboxylate reductase